MKSNAIAGQKRRPGKLPGQRTLPAENQQNTTQKFELGFGVFGVCLGPKFDPNR
jgi:hypothetical protein